MEPDTLGSSRGELSGRPGEEKRRFPGNEDGLALEDPHWREMCAVLRPLWGTSEPGSGVFAVMVGLSVLMLTPSKCTKWRELKP